MPKPTEQEKKEMLEERIEELSRPDLVEREVRDARQKIGEGRQRSKAVTPEDRSKHQKDARVAGLMNVMDDAREKELQDLEKKGTGSKSFKEHAERQPIMENLEAQLANLEPGSLQEKRLKPQLEKRLNELKLKDTPGVKELQKIKEQQTKKAGLGTSITDNIKKAVSGVTGTSKERNQPTKQRNSRDLNR